jgi:hypothetical protein
MRPVDAMFARTMTPAAVSRSANWIALGRSAFASSISRCNFWRGGSMPSRMAFSISRFFGALRSGMTTRPVSGS